jgi:suppressor of fused
MSNESLDDHEVEPIGWDAIDGALARIYGGREPKHYGTILPMMLGGNDPLQGISVYKNVSPEPHYHFVTYGFSELYEKESDDPEFSGFGFELTFRLACGADDPDEPPPWPLNLLQNLARYVFKSGNAFDERHHMTLNGPIAIGQSTDITAIMLILDPELQEIDTRNGHVKFLQIVGLCEDEYGSIQQGYFDPVSTRVSALAPLAITDIFRPSILRDKAVLDAITSAEPDSTQREVFGTIVEWSDTSGQLELRIGATIIKQLKQMFRNLAANGDSIAVYGRGTGVVFELGSRSGWKVEEPLLIVSLTEDSAACVADELQPMRGEYQKAGNVKITVAPVDIRDGEGNVVKTVG